MRISSGHAKLLADVETPALVVDGAALDQNIADAARWARDASVVLRPHGKTHKSVAVAKRQLAAGAEGITVATADEACIFLEAGVPSVTIARPIIRAETAAAPLRIAARLHADLRFSIDSVESLAACSAAAESAARSASAYIEVDVGHARCGVDPSGPTALELTAALEADHRLHSAGLLSHAGHGYAASLMKEVRAAADAERAALVALADRIQATGAPRPAVSVGSTPGLHARPDLRGVDEVRPGNYVFNDLMQARLAPDCRIALGVLARVISVQSGRAVLDAGSKALSSDQGAHGSRGVAGFGRVRRLDGSATWTLTRQSEEHGVIDLNGAAPPQIGELAIVTPNHACVVANLFPSAIELKPDGETSELTIDARR